MIVSVEEYRKMLNDQTSTEERIRERVEFLESFCRNLAKFELEHYVHQITKKRASTN